jgi:hypothetical protein
MTRVGHVDNIPRAVVHLVDGTVEQPQMWVSAWNAPRGGAGGRREAERVEEKKVLRRDEVAQYMVLPGDR